MGIGTASPDAYDAVADNFVIYSTGHTGMSIVSGESHTGTFYFADLASDYQGGIVYNHTVSVMYCHVGAVSQMSITTAGINGDFNDTSDVALKQNIQPISSGLSIVNALNPVTFDWIQETAKRNDSNSGFIAQEVEAILPNDVSGTDFDVDEMRRIEAESADNESKHYSETGKSINVTGIVAHLTKAVQELSAKVEALENE